MRLKDGVTTSTQTATIILSQFRRKTSSAIASTTSFRENNSGLEAGIINGPVNAQFHYYAPLGRSQGSKLVPH